MTAWTDAQAVLAEARARGDCRAVHAAQRALERMTAAQLRAEIAIRKAQQRTGRPRWFRLPSWMRMPWRRAQA